VSVSLTAPISDELVPGQRIQARDRLVEQQQPGTLGQREGERHLGALSAGELADRAVGRDVEVGEPLVREPGVPALVELAAELDQLGRAEIAVERGVLGDEADIGQRRASGARVAAEDAHLALVRPQQADGQVQQVGLARPVRPDQGGDPPGGQPQGAVAQRPGAPVALAQARGLQRGLLCHGFEFPSEFS
jgi:hypothetical protein